MPNGSIIEPLTRIVLFIVSGVLIGLGLNAEVVEDFLKRPEVVGLITSSLTAGWYALAKWLGRKT